MLMWHRHVSLALLFHLASCNAYASYSRLLAPQRTASSPPMPSPRMAAQLPEERWAAYKTAMAAGRAFSDEPSTPESAITLCRFACESREADPDLVCEALLALEKSNRAKAKSDGGQLSRDTIAALDGAWRLVFTTGTVETQSKLGRKLSYFPLRATQSFDTKSMKITNGIYVGELPLLKFFGTFDWLEERRRLEFDFDAIAVLGVKFDLPKGGAEQLGAATGLGAEGNVKRAQAGKKAFFNWISADGEVATARGGGGGLALWRRDAKMEAQMRA